MSVQEKLKSAEESKYVRAFRFGTLLDYMFLIFMTLKLVGVIDWSWWWVTAPLWMPIALLAAIFSLAGILYLIAKGLEKKVV
jgi:hypothetical protein